MTDRMRNAIGMTAFFLIIGGIVAQICILSGWLPRWVLPFATLTIPIGCGMNAWADRRRRRPA